MWKCTYHTGRALMNCITMLDDGTAKEMGDGFADKKKSGRGSSATGRKLRGDSRLNLTGRICLRGTGGLDAAGCSSRDDPEG